MFPIWVEQVNRLLFLAINPSVHPGYLMDGIARFSAVYLIFLIVPVLLLLAARGRSAIRPVSVIVLAILYSSVLAHLVASLVQHPRPFVDGLGMLLIEHGPSPSFPSRHMAVACAFALGLVFQYGFRKTWPALVLAGIVGWARVYVGVHYPVDMLGSVAVALVSYRAARMSVDFWNGLTAARLTRKAG
ncbi:phosphatase PAP2 family protein [Laribacter hongkongensis]|uniref:phosphatase PAP2 family protein n=1 Tax=Laribacter hongkongensis TaxID=168471 RepID=UPI001EFD0ECD|nr:phosphatase PAP2 family protein [Laribacter hongkongensis]MCG9057087.1 phosphatase PAP2 family protein [Laribacter hongkongensis]